MVGIVNYEFVRGQVVVGIVNYEFRERAGHGGTSPVPQRDCFRKKDFCWYCIHCALRADS